MRRSGAVFLVTFALLAAWLAQSASADISPYYSHGAYTDFCTKCHDIHQAEGDYALTREATVTRLCVTCHGLFGKPAPPYPEWTVQPTDFAGTDPTASSKLAYQVDMAGMTADQMDAVPGHSLGVMLDGAVVRNTDSIPDSSATLKVMISGAYGGPNLGYYNGEPATSFNGTKGLYCASCHTVHDVMGQMIPGPNLLSARPNHDLSDPPATDETGFCLSCHNMNLGVDANQKTHPSQFCLSCHGNPAGGTDFPHTSTNKRLLIQEPDALCLSCHTAGMLP